jgi:hypothetical protein
MIHNFLSLTPWENPLLCGSNKNESCLISFYRFSCPQSVVNFTIFLQEVVFFTYAPSAHKSQLSGVIKQLIMAWSHVDLQLIIRVSKIENYNHAIRWFFHNRVDIIERKKKGVIYRFGIGGRFFPRAARKQCAIRAFHRRWKGLFCLEIAPVFSSISAALSVTLFPRNSTMNAFFSLSL